MKKQMHRLLSLMLSLILVVGMIPGSLMTAYAEGSGDDCYIVIDGTKIDDLNNAAFGSGSVGGTWTYTPGTTPTIKLKDYYGTGICLYDETPENGRDSNVRFEVIVDGNCTIAGSNFGIGLFTDTEFYKGGNEGVRSDLIISLEDNASLTINANVGIANRSFRPFTDIRGEATTPNCKVDINASSVGISAYGSYVLFGTPGVDPDAKMVTYGGDVFVYNGVILDVKAADPFINNESYAPATLIVRQGAMVSMTSTTDEDFIYLGTGRLYEIPDEYTAYINSKQSELLLYIPAEPEFKNQTPAGNDDETTGLTGYTVGDTATFTFDSDTPNGFTVKKSAKLKGLFAGLDEDQTVSNDTDSALTLTHEFENAGLYQLTETLELYFGSQLVGKKTHSFLIEVAAKPLVTPTITQQPTSVTKATGDSVTLTAKATDANRARWYVEKSDGTVVALGDALTDGTSTQTISKASNAVGNRYFCAFWSEDDKIAKTDSVTVCFVPTVTSNGNVTVAAGNTAFLKVTESGCGHYAAANGWYKDGVELTSGDKYYIMGTTLAVQNATDADAGTYTYKYVTKHGDEVTADVALTVNTGSSSTTIDTFDITGLDNPVILGTVADTSVSVPTGANYTVESVTWTAGVNGSGVVTGSSGTVSIKLKAKDGYTFKSGDLAGTVEGIYKTVYSVPANATEITVTVDYNNYSSWKIAYPANDTISISTDSLTFKAGTAANGQKVEGAFNCTHSGLADTNLHHTGMKYAVYSIADNAMPAGLTLNADGTITGTPTTAGVYTVMVRADSVNASGTASNCSGLAVKAIEIIVESDAHIHDWDLENPVSDSATCTADGVKVISCKNGCGETITVTSPATGHDWGEWPSYITPRCNEAPITITRTCENDESHTDSKTINGIHMATDWTTDETHHWKVCGYCKTKILVEKDAHKDTNSDNKCDTCEYDMTPAVQPTEIDSITIEGLPAMQIGQTRNEYYSSIMSNRNDGTYKVNGNAYADGFYGNLETDGFEFMDENKNLIPANDSVFTEGTYYFSEVFKLTEGYEFADVVTVNVTGVADADVEVMRDGEWLGVDVKFVLTESAPTEYDITVTGGTASANKAVAGTVITLTVDESAIPAGKVFDKWEVVSGGVTVTDGKFTMPESAVEIKATYKDAPVSHTCDIKPVAKDEPSCTEGGKEAYYKCEGCGKFYEDALGAKEITDLANWGNLPKLGHTESDWKSDKDNHWKECTVTACGVIIEDSKAAHKDDNKDGKCDVCEYNVGLPTTPDDDKPNDNPQTGDNSNMFLWIALLFISGAGVVATTVFGKKRFSVK